VKAALAFEAVSFRYVDHLVLANFSLAVGPAEIVALLGPSGCGKTSAIRMALGFLAPSEGAVLLDGEAVSRDGRILKPPEERNLAVVFQDLALWPHLTVHGNLAFGLDSSGCPRRERDARIDSALRRVELLDKRSSYPGDLSGGEKQRVAIARALVLEPRAILMDEPLSNLDVTLKRELLALFRELFLERHSTALYVTHDLREADAIGDRIAVLEAGRIVQQGPLPQLRDSPATAFVENLIRDLEWRR
jgi:ABC-type Fe3+/spermidine/putrescine transport system ATPase subunit